MKNVIVVSDAGLDPDDVVAILCLAKAHKQGLINLLGFVGNLYPAHKRSALIKTVLVECGLENIPVGIGTDCNQVRKVKPYEFAIDLVEYARLEKIGEDLIYSLLVDADHKSVSLLLISGLTDIARLMIKYPSLLVDKVKEIYVMGGARFSEDSLIIDNTASNNKFDLDSAHIFHSEAIKLGMPLNILTRFAAYECFVDKKFYDQLATRHKVGAYLQNIQKSSITSLWEYANNQPTTERQNRQWFCNTFCGQDNIPIASTESPWEFIKGFSLYDPATVVWMLLPDYFQPLSLVIKDTKHSIVGVSAESNGVVNGHNIINKIEELANDIYKF